MTDYMVDIETLGKDPGAAIASIGAVRFSVDGGVGDGDEEFFESVSLADCQAHGLTIDAETLSWWLNQPAQAREQLHGGRDLASALRRLSEFVDGADTMWACGPQFDFVILREAYQAVGRGAPWQYWVERDSRTVREEFGEWWPDRDQDGTAHNAVNDARFQAECLVECLREVSGDA